MLFDFVFIKLYIKIMEKLDITSFENVLNRLNEVIEVYNFDEKL